MDGRITAAACLASKPAQPCAALLPHQLLLLLLHQGMR
jgi:hypothetical protein